VKHVVVLRTSASGPCQHGAGPRSLVARGDRSRPLARPAREPDRRRRAPALHPLHLGLDRQAQGRAAHHRRLPGRHARHDQVRVRSRDDDVYWCTADVGWVTGHSYIVYGPLSNGATVPDVRGRAQLPRLGPLLAIIEKHGVTIFYTAPTAIRAFMRGATSGPKKHDLSSLRLLGSVGEPINPEAWMWYHRTSAGVRCPSSTRGGRPRPARIMMTPLPGASPTKPGSTRACRSSASSARGGDADGERAGRPNEGGLLVSSARGRACCAASGATTSASSSSTSARSPACYFTGDGARRDEDGYFWVVGRVDDVLNVAGHRIGTAEIESALVAPVGGRGRGGRPPRRPQGPGAGRVRDAAPGFTPTPSSRRASSASTWPRRSASSPSPTDPLRRRLPKTRSGKIMRRLLKDVAAGRETSTGDTTTLEDLDMHVRDLAHFGERGPEHVSGRVKRKIAHVKSVAHAAFSPRGGTPRRRARRWG
jgi:acetyl-CoA synthetase